MKARRLRTRLARLLVGLGMGKLGAAGEILPVEPPGDLQPREVRVWVPSEVKADTPLLIALDGQMMPAWRLGEALGQLRRETGLPEPIVVTIAATSRRMDEYGLAHCPDYQGRGALAAAFQRYVVEQVLPAVRARYGIETAPVRTGVFGASLGGLAAFDLAWNHPDVFGFAGVFSGSLWWRADDTNAAARQKSRLAHRMVREAAAKPHLRLWFQAGTADEKDDRDGNGVIDAIQDTTELIDELERRGFRRGEDVFYHEVAGGEHHERTWAQALPVFLRWALGAPE